MKIFCITGTKGKTTVARIIGSVLHSMGENILRVDSDGCYINQKLASTYAESLRLFGNQAPSVCPGKYLIMMRKYFPHFAAVLEASIGCHKEGLGYNSHQIGIFTNIYFDHINPAKGRRNQADLAEAKSFVLKKTAEGGYFIFNADDRNVCRVVNKGMVSKGKLNFIPVGSGFRYFNIKRHLKNNGTLIALENNHIKLKTMKSDRKIADLKDIKWTYGGAYMPAVYAALFSVAALYAYYESKIPDKVVSFLSKYQPDKLGGRMVSAINDSGVEFLIDYAHERGSLVELAKFGKKNKKKSLIGILRLPPNVSNQEISIIGNKLGYYFDQVVIYDKLDGIFRGDYVNQKSGIARKVGEISRLFHQSFKTNEKCRTKRTIFEERAVEYASKIAKKGDLVIYIWGENRTRSFGYLRKYFNLDIA